MISARLIVLGAGRPRDQGGQPSLRQLSPEHHSVLGWQIHAFNGLVAETDFVGGYELDRIIRRFPDLTYHFNPHWDTTGAGQSLASALETLHLPQELYITYGDVLLRRDLTRALADPQRQTISVALELDSPASRPLPDGRMPERLEARGVTGELVGIVHVPESCFERFRAFVLEQVDRHASNGLSHLLTALARLHEELPLRVVPAGGRWAHLEDGRSVVRFILGTKGVALDNLRDTLALSSILPLMRVRRDDWRRERSSTVRLVLEHFAGCDALVVRSSARDEDGFENSNAGRYESVLDVEPREHSLAGAVDTVFQSYGECVDEDEVLIQRMLRDIRASGVIFTRQLGTGAPYYVLNYSCDGDTTTVTGGRSSDAIVFNVARCVPASIEGNLPWPVSELLAAVREIEGVLAYDRLDVEFAVAADDTLYVLQVRPLALHGHADSAERDGVHSLLLQELHEHLSCMFAPAPRQVGARTCFSVMADWNPAEILGARPTPLALELYRHIITDRTWARQRRDAGYRDLTRWPLVRGFAGQPFVDVRASLNSFIPAAVSDEQAARVVDFAMEQLIRTPQLHDKLEFELLPTCMDFGYERWSDRFVEAGVLDVASAHGYGDALRAISRGIITRTAGDLAAARRRDEQPPCESLSRRPRAERIRALLEDTRDNGALGFAHLARAGFVAIALLRSAVSTGILDPARYDELMRSVQTVGSVMSHAAWSVKQGDSSREAFIRRFGHLRPKTYEVTSSTYAGAPHLFIDPVIESSTRPRATNFTFTATESEALDRALAKARLEMDSGELLQFVHDAVYGREYGKFVFTRTLSHAIDLLAQEASDLGVTDEQVGCISLAGVLEHAVDHWDDGARRQGMAGQVAERLARYRRTGLTLLPAVISAADDVFAFEQPTAWPNFITASRCTAPLVVLSSQLNDSNLAGRLVAIENADPGYDYLFSLNIEGLVTAYGGPNSHMAIRASEFGLPSVIGIGSRRFAELRTGMIVALDCGSGSLRIEGSA